MVLAQVDLRGGLEAAWERIVLFGPKLLGFLAILLVGYFVAKAIQKILDKVLERVGFNRWVERGGIKRALERSKYDASDILSKIVFYIIFLCVLQLAFGVFGPNPISELLSGVVAFLPKLFAAILILVVAGAIAAAVRELVATALGGLSYGNLLANVAMAAIWFVGFSAALNQIEIAPAIVNGLFYAVLALVVGSAIVAIGGGGIEPMRERWRRALERLDDEAPKVRDEAQGAGDRIRDRAEEVREQAHSDTATDRETGSDTR
ncbi:MAG TPA: hypothetical protein VG709_04265 [Actinomycetota bacterium]|nr:hypothetical protein [Actinomycetota bacterium]